MTEEKRVADGKVRKQGRKLNDTRKGRKLNERVKKIIVKKVGRKEKKANEEGKESSKGGNEKE